MKKDNIIKAVCVAAILAIICTGYYMVTIWRASETEEKDNTDEPYKGDIPDDVVIAGDTVKITVDDFKNCVRILLSMGKSYNEAVSDATHRLENKYGLYAEALKKGYSATEEETEEYVKQLKGDIEKAANKDEMSEFINSYGDNGEYWEMYKNQARIDCVLNKYNQDLENEFQSSYKGELYSEKYNDDWDIYYEKLKEDSAKNENFKVVKNVDEIIVDDNSSDVTADKNVDKTEYINEYFPYNENTSQTFDIRCNYQEFAGFREKVSYERIGSGNNREVWHLIFNKEKWSDNNKTYKKEYNTRNLGYLFLTKDNIAWIKDIVPEELDKISDSFIKDNILPKDSLLICAENEVKDEDSDKTGIHSEIITCGSSQDVRQFTTWNIKKGHSDEEDITVFAFKRNVGLIAYGCYDTQSRAQAMQVWNDECVKCDDLYDEFVYE